MPRRKVDDRTMRAAIESGMTCREAVRRFGIGQATYYRYRTRFNLAKPNAKLPVDADRLRRMVEAGVPAKIVAHHLGCGMSTLRRRASELGLTWRKPLPDIAEWVTWDAPVPGRGGVVDRETFADAYRQYGCAGTASYLNISTAAVSQRAARMRAQGVL